MDRNWQDVPRTLFIVPEITAWTHWRTLWPSQELQANGYMADCVEYQNMRAIMPQLVRGRWNTLVTPRWGFDTAELEDGWLQVVDQLRRETGIAWWYELDDDQISEGFLARLETGAREGICGPEERRAAEVGRSSRLRLMSAADGVVVASSALASIIERHTKRVVVVPNGIDAAWFVQQSRARPREISPVTVGWSGAARLEEELEPIYDVWPELAREFPDVSFVMQGWCPPRLRDALPEGQFHFIPTRSIQQYPSALSNIDIYCCFAGRPWQRTKTPIGWFQATLAGAACAVSSVLYGDFVSDGRNALVASTSDEWLTALRRLVQDATLRRSIQSAAQQTVMQNHTIAQTYQQWLQAFACALGSKHAAKLVLAR